MDYGWHHIGCVQDGNGYILVFFDGMLLGKFDEPNYVDLGKARGTGILSVLNGDNNSWSIGYFDDICLIGGEALWDSDFEPPKIYLGSPLYNLYNNEDDMYGIRNNE